MDKEERAKREAKSLTKVLVKERILQMQQEKIQTQQEKSIDNSIYLKPSNEIAYSPFFKRRNTLTKKSVEIIIYSLAKSKKHTDAEVVCLLYCFGIISDKDKLNQRHIAKRIAQKTGLREETVRIYLGKFNSGRKHSVEISLKQNLRKVQVFVKRHNVSHLLVVDITSIPK